MLAEGIEPGSPNGKPEIILGVGFGSMVGRIGGVTAPFIILLPSFVPYLVFGKLLQSLRAPKMDLGP